MELSIETSISAPAETVWDILGRRFAEIEDWSSTVRSSRPLTLYEVPAGLSVASGAPVPGRETTTRAARLREVLTEYSDAERVLTFHGVGLPRFLTLATDRQSVHAVDAQHSRVTFDIRVEGGPLVRALGPLLARRMRRTFGTVQDDLRVRAEAAHAAGGRS